MGMKSQQLNEVTYSSHIFTILVLKSDYRQISNIRHIKSPNLNVSHLILQLSFPIHWSQALSQNEDVVGAAPAGDAPTQSEWSTNVLPIMVQLILEIWQYSRITGSLIMIPWLLMPWLLISPSHQQPNKILTMQNKPVLVFQEEGFQLPVSYPCWEMIENGNTFLYFLIKFSTIRFND